MSEVPTLQDLNATIGDLWEDRRPTLEAEPTVPPGSSPCSQAENWARKMSRFDYVGDLGEGACGTVWRAQDTEIGRTVAIKSYKFAGPLGQEMLTRETCIAGRLDHPNIPTLYDVRQTENGQYHCIMKVVEGRDLQRLLDQLRSDRDETRQQVRIEQRVDLIIQVLRVLSVAHANGLVHRDIKPENIRVGPTGEVYLMDWGIALNRHESDGAGVVMGTPQYMAPEQAARQAIDHRADLYAVTAILFELLTLRRHGPEATSLDEMLEQVQHYTPSYAALHHPHPVYGGYPQCFRQVLEKGLEIDPADRYQSAAEMLQELEDILSGEVSVSCPNTLVLAGLARVKRLVVAHARWGVAAVISTFTTLLMLAFALGVLAASSC